MGQHLGKSGEGQRNQLVPELSVATAQNRRDYQEDRYLINTCLVLPHYDFPEWSGSNGLFVICDGHGGSGCAEFCTQYVTQTLMQLCHGKKKMTTCLKQCIKGVSDAWYAKQYPNGHGPSTPALDDSGCTFVGLLINYGSGAMRLVVVGDSELRILSRKTGAVIFHHTIHDLSDARELATIQKRKAALTGEPCRITGTKPYQRVNGDLNMSRAIGDLRDSTEGCISATPEIHELHWSDFVAHDPILFLASDGLWDEKQVELTPLMSASDVVDEVRKQRGPESVGDNVTVIVLRFKGELESRHTIAATPSKYEEVSPAHVTKRPKSSAGQSRKRISASSIAPPERRQTRSTSRKA